MPFFRSAPLFLTAMAPLASFFVIALLARRHDRLSARISIGAVAISFICSVALLLLNLHISGQAEYTANLLESSGVNIPFGFLLDRLNLLMIVVVSTICLLVQVYSLWYMAGDPGFSRYYCYMSLFAWAMLNLCLSATILQLYIFWELVGLSSYLLIGFWYEKFSASEAGKKAFVMTRAGDAAFFIGFLLLYLHTGNVSIRDLDNPAALSGLSPFFVTLSALLIFGGVVGKSAQFPLLTWLPDAMEGPTPVSALLHSATMVAAGVYLLARLFPFFSMSPAAMDVVLAIGAISMILSSTMAMVSRDIKRVWAFSTISQLGFMVMALGAGGYFAGVYHLTTHAGFKALLFLCSGVFIHKFETNDVYDLARMGARRFTVPAVAIVLGAAALSGLPPFSGFFSKEEIIESLARLPNPVWLAAGLAGVFLTGYYSFRVIFILLSKSEGPGAADEERGAGAEEKTAHGAQGKAGILEPSSTAWPLIILALSTVLLGWPADTPLRNFLLGGGMAPALAHAPEGGHLNLSHVAALILAAGGLVLAWFEFGRGGGRQKIGFVEKIPPLYDLFAQRWYIDHFYRLLVNLVVDRGLSYLCWQNDQKVIDAGIDELCEGTVESGRVVSIWQTVMIQYRLLAIFAVVVLMAAWYWWPATAK
jgi:NADH-quinone oxidoreductase subunit L